MRVTTGSAGGAFGFRGGVSGTAAFYRILAAVPTGSAANVMSPDLPVKTGLLLPEMFVPIPKFAVRWLFVTWGFLLVLAIRYPWSYL